MKLTTKLTIAILASTGLFAQTPTGTTGTSILRVTRVDLPVATCTLEAARGVRVSDVHNMPNVSIECLLNLQKAQERLHATKADRAHLRDLIAAALGAANLSASANAFEAWPPTGGSCASLMYYLGGYSKLALAYTGEDTACLKMADDTNEAERLFDVAKKIALNCDGPCIAENAEYAARYKAWKRLDDAYRGIVRYACEAGWTLRNGICYAYRPTNEGGCSPALTGANFLCQKPATAEGGNAPK